MKHRKYCGTARISANGVDLGNVQVFLTAYLTEPEVLTTSGVISVPGTNSWDGELEDLTESQRLSLVGQRLKLLLPSGKSGEAKLTEISGHIEGMKGPPF